MTRGANKYFKRTKRLPVCHSPSNFSDTKTPDQTHCALQQEGKHRPHCSPLLILSVVATAAAVQMVGLSRKWGCFRSLLHHLNHSCLWWWW